MPLEHLVENWSSVSTWTCLAEAAAVAGDVALATRLADHLVPYSGRIAISGISSVMGPVDGSLALALATCGQGEQATAAAERGLDQAAAWGFTEYAAWLTRRRQQLGI